MGLQRVGHDCVTFSFTFLRGGNPRVSSFRDGHLSVFSVVFLFTYCAVLQSTPLLALLFVPPSLWVCWQRLALESLRHCAHPPTGAVPLRLAAVLQYSLPHLDLLWGRWRQLKPWSIPAPICTCPQSPTAAKARSIPGARTFVVLPDVS